MKILRVLLDQNVGNSETTLKRSKTRKPDCVNDGIQKIIIMLKNLFILFALTFCLTSLQAQITVDVRLENQTIDTWTGTITDSNGTTFTVTLLPNQVHTGTYTLVPTITFAGANSSVPGCTFSTGPVIALVPPQSGIYPINCGNTTEVEVTTTINFPPVTGTFEAIIR